VWQFDGANGTPPNAPPAPTLALRVVMIKLTWSGRMHPPQPKAVLGSVDIFSSLED